MPSFYNVRVDLDLEDIFEQIESDDLMEEVRDRGLSPVINKRDALRTLKETANFLRDHNNPALALGIDDLISDLDLV